MVLIKNRLVKNGEGDLISVGSNFIIFEIYKNNI